MATRCTPTQLPFHPFGRREVAGAQYLYEKLYCAPNRPAPPPHSPFRGRPTSRGKAIPGGRPLRATSATEP